uniref:DUF229 domain containing protein n=1 Tax=Caenorhabditis tropicalis TaxID=1561998 RepID=A0A1I7U2D4_9PELO
MKGSFHSGKLIKVVRGEFFGGAHIPVDWDKKQFCNTYLNGSIFDDFNDQGYMTFMIDDWKDQMVNWPDCKGFKDAPMHHTMHPFFFIYEKKGTSKTKKHLKGDLCREIYHAAFEYFQDFMDNYKDQPKFTWSWISTVGHDHVNGFMRVDKHMNEILEKNMEVFDNSFVLFMGDHGLRLSGSGFLRTDIGIFEKNNPYFSISIPKKLRKTPELLDVMRENSKKLQTLFDIRSTLLDIARYQPKSDFTNRSVDEVAGERGHSFLRRQPDTLRTCGRLPIPPEYCICQVGKVEVDDENLKDRFGHGFIDHNNKLLDDKNLSSVCERFQLQEVTSLLHHGFLNQTKPNHFYDIVVSTGSPSYAQFQTLITYDQKKNKTSFGSVMRLDTYGETGDCGRELESMCFCKNLSTFTKWNYQRKMVYPSLINYLLNFFFDQ